MTPGLCEVVVFFGYKTCSYGVSCPCRHFCRGLFPDGCDLPWMREVLFPCFDRHGVYLNLMMAPSFFQSRSVISIVPDCSMMARGAPRVLAPVAAGTGAVAAVFS